MNRRFNADFSKLESDQRKKILPADNILNQLHIHPGDTIIDFGCGIGYFSIPATQHVGKTGTVIAIDINQDMIDELTKRTQKIPNIKIIKTDTITGYKADVILLIAVLHEIKSPQNFLNDCFNSLKENGRIAIIDWQKKETKGGPPQTHRLSKEHVIKMARKQYLDHDIDDSFYFLEFVTEH